METQEKVVMSRNEEIGLVYGALSGKEEPAQEELTATCANLGIENAVGVDEYADYRYQAVNDERFAALVPEVMAAVSKLQYVRSFLTPAERQAVIEANDAIRVEVCQLIEKHGIPYILLDNVVSDIGGNIAGIFKSAVITLNNKTGEMFMDLGRKHFNTKEVTMAHVGKYAEDLFAKKDADKAAADQAAASADEAK